MTKATNWEWNDDKGNWISYEHKDNVLIETAFRTRDTSSSEQTFCTTDLSFNAAYKTKYTYDFKKLTQKNEDSGRVRKLRRIETSEEDSDEMGFCALMKLPSLKGEELEKAAITAGMLKGGWMGAASSSAAPADIPLSDKKTVDMPDGAEKTKDEETGEEGAKKCEAEAATIAPPVKKFKLDLPGLASWAYCEAKDDEEEAGSKKIAVGGVASSTSSSGMIPSVSPAVVAAQIALGAQSRRKQPYHLGPSVSKDVHGKKCFDTMLYREKKMAGEWGVFYHSYSFAALLYEVQAAVAAVLFRFKSEYATLPRLLKEPYKDLPEAEDLLKLFPKMTGRDHDPRFRAVAISVVTTLLGSDMEAPPTSIFLSGYSCADLSFRGVLEKLLVSCGVPNKDKKHLAQKIIDLSEKYGLDVSQFGGKPCKSGRQGHLLQIFVKRSIVDKFAYAALPFGVKDSKRPVLSAALEADGPIQGQARIVVNPSVFMRGNAVRMYVHSADPTFDGNRSVFQKELTELLSPIIGAKDVRLKAAEGIYGGKVPSWFNPEDFEAQKKGGTSGS